MPRQSLKQRSDGRYACVYKGTFFYGATQSEALAKREAYKLELARGLRKEMLRNNRKRDEGQSGDYNWRSHDHFLRPL